MCLAGSEYGVFGYGCAPQCQRLLTDWPNLGNLIWKMAGVSYLFTSQASRIVVLRFTQAGSFADS